MDFSWEFYVLYCLRLFGLNNQSQKTNTKKQHTMQINLHDCPVPILQDEWEFSVLLDYYKGLQPKTVLEIGSFYGGTLWYWIQHSKSLEKLISVDNPITKHDERFKEMMEARSKWDTWMLENEILFHEIIGDSTGISAITKVSECCDLQSVDFLMIDGGHEYRTVRSDYLTYSKFVREDGLIIFHDVIGIKEVNKFWTEVKIGKKYVEICNNSTVWWGIGIIFK